MSRRYFDPDLDPGATWWELAGAEAHHLGTVCRGRPGAAIEIFNGAGLVVEAIVREVARRSVRCEILSAKRIPAPERGLTIAVGLPKGDRADFLVEKCTELGVRRLVPLAAARAVVDPRATKLDRLRRVVIEACKQSGRAHLMTIDEVVPLQHWIDYQPAPGYLLDPAGETIDVTRMTVNAVGIGPEGGWTEAELELARRSGWSVVRWPGNILRVETAAIAFAAAHAAYAAR